MTHKKVYRVLVYLAILGAVGTGATYAKYVSSVGSDRESAVVSGFNVVASLSTSGTSNMTENVATDTGINSGNFKFEIKNSATSQQMTVAFTNNSKVWVRIIASGGAVGKTNLPSVLANQVIKQGESKSYDFNMSSTYGLSNKSLNFIAEQVLSE